MSVKAGQAHGRPASRAGAPREYGMRARETVLLAAAPVPWQVVTDRAQRPSTLGFHIILACFGIALPSIVLLAEFIGLRRRDETAMRLARRWSQAMGVLIAVGA